jgi:hypothetical protein
MVKNDKKWSKMTKNGQKWSKIPQVEGVQKVTFPKHSEFSGNGSQSWGGPLW